MGRGMSVANLLAELRKRGVELRPQGDRLLYRPTDAVPPALRDRLRASKPQILRELQTQGDQLLDRFLEDETIPAAVCHSRALGRDFVLARDEAALEALTEADQRLPVLYFGEAAKLRHMGLDGLRALLDFRAEFGPKVEIRSVKVASA